MLRVCAFKKEVFSVLVPIFSDNCVIVLALLLENFFLYTEGTS
jgi:hypothetical protein